MPDCGGLDVRPGVAKLPGRQSGWREAFSTEKAPLGQHVLLTVGQGWPIVGTGRNLLCPREGLGPLKKHTTPPPPPGQVGCRSPFWWEHPRLAWWTLKAARFNKVVVIFVVVLSALWIGFLALLCLLADFDPWRAVIAAVLGIVAYLLVVLVASSIVWIGLSLGKRSVVYVSSRGDAVLVLTAQRRSPHWEAKNHVVKRVGRGLGAAMRAAMATPLEVAARAAGVTLTARAANGKVQDIYLEQFASWGMMAAGRRGVTWS